MPTIGDRIERLSITIEDGYRFVVVKGTARLVEDQATAQEDIKQLALRYNGLEAAEQQMREMFSQEQRVSIYLPLKVITAHGF